MPFEFVDNNATIDRAARRRIRSHVAMGKNAGKTIVRSSRKTAFRPGVKSATYYAHVPKVIEDARSAEDNDSVASDIERQIGDGLSVLSFPDSLIRGSKGLVQRTFSFITGPRHLPELTNAIDTTRSPTSAWVRFMFLDEACFHACIAISVLALNSLVLQQEDPKEAMHHVSRAFRLINERLSSNGAISDETLAAVLSLTHYEHLQGQSRQAIVHIDGLQRLVELRGGISNIARTTPYLALKILRADLQFALQLGCKTRYNIEDVEASCVATSGLHSKHIRHGSRQTMSVLHSSDFKTLSIELQNAMFENSNIAWLLNEASAVHMPKLNSYAFHETIILLGYRLISSKPLDGPPPPDPLENAVRLGLVAFIATLLRGFDLRVPNTPVLYDLARSAVQVTINDDETSQRSLLWVLFIGGASIFTEVDDIWLIPRVIQMLQALHLHTWDDTRRMLGGFPWVNAVHDDRGQALFQKSTSLNQVSTNRTPVKRRYEERLV